MSATLNHRRSRLPDDGDMNETLYDCFFRFLSSTKASITCCFLEVLPFLLSRT